ncbi:unnamed protein product [Allacma fusca]|uniref:Uncharacterized protein n=1 Tax=Allacma fusca TaxID=39272 RepID=A0A8J2Q0F0_9HEXA|nr:unnamed protein product [Allacma fusca]
MEDKVLWIALQLFLVWLFAMSFCLCICNCLFIRSDRRKSTASKLAAAQVALERQKRISKQYLECDDEEKLVGSGGVGGKENPLGQPHPDSLSPSRQPQTERQPTDQVSPGLMTQSAYMQRATNPTFIFQHPSADDVNPSPLASQQPMDIVRKPGSAHLTKLESPLMTHASGRLVSIMSISETHSKFYLFVIPSYCPIPLHQLSSVSHSLFGKEKRFSRTETTSDPDLNADKPPSSVPPTIASIPAASEAIPGTMSDASDGNCSTSNSNSSMTLPQPSAFFITEVEGLERPRSSSVSGTTPTQHT